MENYDMQENEVLLWKGNGYVTVSTPEEKDAKLGSCEIVLTNENIVLVSKSKKLFKKEEITVLVYPVSDIKIYENVPQVKQKSNDIDVYMIDVELHITVESFLIARKFVSEAVKLITGESTPERGATKFKGAVNLVDKTLGIDTVNTVKGVVENGIVGTVFGGINKKKNNITNSSKKNSVVSEVTGVAKNLLSNNNDQPVQSEISSNMSNMTVDEQIEAVKKLKELLDSGILTQDEFDAKKKEIMRL